MKPQLIEQYQSAFERCARQHKNTECWSARDLQMLFGYDEWRNFLSIIEKAVESCKNSRQEPKHHFVEINKLIETGKGAQREVQDFFMTRYACYLVAQNGDPRKEVIAFAQSYFALQTRKQELLEERIALQERINARDKLSTTEKRLSENLYQRGVDEHGFARIRSKGDSALFGGHSTGEIKQKLGIKSGALADHLPTITIKAKDFAAELTNFNVEKEDMRGETPITREHIKNNQGVRKLLKERNIVPELLPAAEDTKKLKRRATKHAKKLAGESPRFL